MIRPLSSHVAQPGPVGGGGGTVTRVLSWLFNNNYYVLLIMIPSDRLRVSFRLLVSFFLSLVWAALFFIILFYKNYLINCKTIMTN